MKKLTVIVLCLALCLSMLAACSGEPADTTANVTPSTTKEPVDNTTVPNVTETTEPDDTTTEKIDDITTDKNAPTGTPSDIEAMLPAYPEREQLALEQLGATAAGTVSSDYKTVGKTPISSLSEITDPNGSYYLTTDISANETTIDEFYGVLDGCGHSITTSDTLFTTFGGSIINLTINGDISYSLEPKAPLAIKVTTNALIYNVKSDCNITVNESSTAEGVLAGGFAIYLVGDNVRFVNCEYSGTIKNILNKSKNNRKTGGFIAIVKTDAVADDPDTPFADFIYCTVSGSISASSHVAGLAGQIDSPATVSVYGTVLTGTVRGTFEGNIGGLLGYASGAASANFTFVNCANNGTVKSDCSKFDAGGLMGWAGTSGALSMTSFKWCVNYNEISCLRNAGGLIAVAYGHASFEYCVNYGAINVGVDAAQDISATSSWSGGLAGFIKGGNFTFENCINYGDLNIPTRQARCGGLTGENQQTSTSFLNCANFGDITYTYDNYKSDGTTLYLGDCRIAGISAAGENCSFEVINCVNFGDLKSTIGKIGQPSGGILGFVTPKSAGMLKLENCMNYGDIDVTAQLKDGTAVGSPAAGLVGFIFYGSHIEITGCINGGTIKSNSYAADFILSNLDASALLVGDMTISNNYYIPAYTGEKAYGPFVYNANTKDEDGNLAGGASHDELAAKCTSTTQSALEDSTTNGVAALMNAAAGKENFKCVTVKMSDGVSQKTCVVPAALVDVIAANIAK